MRGVCIVCAVAMLMTALPLTVAQTEDGDDDDDAAQQDAMQIAEQLAPDDASVPAPPVKQRPEEQPGKVELAAAPQPQPAAVATKERPPQAQAAAAPQPQAATPLGDLRSVGMPAALKAFGQNGSVPVTPSLAKPVNMVASLTRKQFGKQFHKAVATKEAQVVADAHNAKESAEVAKQAAIVADKVATHTVHVTEKAKSALKDAQDALHQARVKTSGLTKRQKQTLKHAEKKLKEASKNAADKRTDKRIVKSASDKQHIEVQHGLKVKMDKIKKEEKLKEASKNAADKRIIRSASDKQHIEKQHGLKVKEDKIIQEEKQRNEGGGKVAVAKTHDSELEAMRKELEVLRKELKDKEGDKAEGDAMMKELQDEIKSMEEAEKLDDKKDQKHHDEMKAEIERLRAQVEDMGNDDSKSVTYVIPATPEKAPKPLTEKRERKRFGGKEEKGSGKEEEEKGTAEVEKYKVSMKPTSREEEGEASGEQEVGEATPVETRGIDIDTAMPYGDLEPFGREDTAQELTEDSIKQSNDMVDQLEKAEVAEEKRSVFRALTRLRGAAITSFDGVARSQTGNIDEYNKIHQWRTTHPLHHLADEESDISKWAFPDNAD